MGGLPAAGEPPTIAPAGPGDLSFIVPDAELPTPDPSPATPDALSATRRPRRGLPPWFKFVSMTDPIPGDETARSRRGEPKTVKRRAGGYRAR